MAKVLRKSAKTKKSTREELDLLDKSELIDRIMQLEAYNEQLKALIAKSTGTKLEVKGMSGKVQKSFDFSRCHKRHILLKLYYLGWDYHGFTVQEESNDTIEHHLFAALLKSCCIESRETSNYSRCGRTDKGVSSFSQVISLDIRSKLEPEKQSNLSKELPYCKILNRLLPANIRCLAWCPAPFDFSARFDCKYRKYKYFFPRGDLDIDAMDKAVKYAIGDYDFRNICKMDVANGVTNFKRTVIDAKVFTSNQSVERSTDIETCPQKPQYNKAHEVPLNLWFSDYKDVKWFVDENELINTIKILQQDWALNAIKSTMIKSMLSELECMVNCKSTDFQNDCLLRGAQSRVYQPLMKRDMCKSLENKIKHYEKKRKFEVVHSNVV
ncbi:PREDICTED: tRNA pseudouridine(38/39) synthase isoform X2 [Dinoponera quadriceps]|uniref:tRNA pseudouridine(38/39) synthase isoform X2 n=1 Tax=Dinoponera quadriceps TaxID=609295 RepID=A0A6P3XLV8_DINQU|nr:PREDICTED: tRNA pseudouridine(38/39) synthase isoform X2 [Dinoponera quadriceps]